MKAKEYLQQLDVLRVKIRELEERTRFYEDLATKCTASYSMSAAKGGSGEGRVSAAAAEAVDKAAEMRAEIAAYFALEREITAVIREVENPTCRTLLECRYIAGWSLSKTADVMGYDYDYVRKLHGRALAMVSPPEKIHTESSVEM